SDSLFRNTLIRWQGGSDARCGDTGGILYESLNLLTAVTYRGSHMPEEALWAAAKDRLSALIEAGDVRGALALVRKLLRPRAVQHANAGAKGELPDDLQEHYDSFAVRRKRSRDDEAVKEAFIDSFESLVLLVNADGEGRQQFLRATLWPAESRMIDGKRGCNRALVAGGNNWNCLVVDKDGSLCLANQTKAAKEKHRLAMDPTAHARRDAFKETDASRVEVYEMTGDELALEYHARGATKSTTYANSNLLKRELAERLWALRREMRGEAPAPFPFADKFEAAHARRVAFEETDASRVEVYEMTGDELAREYNARGATKATTHSGTNLTKLELAERLWALRREMRGEAPAPFPFADEVHQFFGGDPTAHASRARREAFEETDASRVEVYEMTGDELVREYHARGATKATKFCNIRLSKRELAECLWALRREMRGEAPAPFPFADKFEAAHARRVGFEETVASRVEVYEMTPDELVREYHARGATKATTYSNCSKLLKLQLAERLWALRREMRGEAPAPFPHTKTTMLASGTPFFQEFHCVLQDDALGLLIKPMNDIPVVRGLKPGADGMPGAAERAGVTVGSILVAVNGRETLREGFKATMLAAKTASRPVTLGFRRLHAVTEPVPEQGPRPARRYWQGYLFARFAAARSWTGRFYVLREDGELRAYPGKDLVDGGHVEDLRVVHAPLRASAEDVAAAARTVGDLGDDGRGSLDPRAFAAPVVDGDVGAARDGPSDATRWAFFRGETPEARLDWIAALTTLAVAFEEKGDDDGSSADAGATTVAVGLASAKREVARQGYLWVKAVKGDEEDDEETRGVGELVAAATAAATLEVSQRLAPWRRRWFVLSEAGELLWYVSPPADDGEVPTGRFASLEDATVALAAVADRATLEGVDPSEAAHRRRRFEFSVREARGERRTVKLTALSAHEGKQWVAALEAAAALKVEPLPIVDDGGDDDAAGPATEEPCDEEPVEKPRPPSRSPSVPAAREPAREKPREVSDEKDREARLIALSANPGVVLKLPEAAYGLLVPRGSGGGGVDRGAFTALAGQRLVPLCDCYVADLVYDALLASQAAGGARDSPQTVAQNTGLTKVLSLGKTESPRGDVDEDFLGKNLLGKIGGLKAYTSAKKGLTRAAADAGAVVSELLYEAQAKGLKSSRDAAAKRASANVQTSRRAADCAAEPIQGTCSASVSLKHMRRRQ
ncbi:hypothetical protein AURANDRAFT_68849, partial [Aureococcus anophagefferens]